jgi:hypothetical protein
MRIRAVVVVYLAAAVVAAAVAVPAARALLPRRPADAVVPAVPASAPPSAPVTHLRLAGQQPPPPPTVHLPADPAAITGPPYLKFFGWALQDRRTGQTSGSANRETATNTTESMLKVWLAADYLRHTPNAGTGALGELHKMIVDSDDNLALKYFHLDGGDDAIRELVPLCGLTNTHTPGVNEWSITTMSPADAVRLGACVARGTAAGPKWTGWLLQTMREVRGGVGDQHRTSGGGRWGIIDALPPDVAAATSIKNGWTAQPADHNWHVNCLAIHPDWVLAVELRYPFTSPDGDWHDANNLKPGADACASVARQLLTPAG